MLTATPLGMATAVAGITAGLAGAACAGAIRAIAGDAPAALAGAVVAGLLAIALFAEHGLVRPVPCLALAAAAWTVIELARTTTSPLVAMLPAVVAAILEPAAIALLPIAGTRLLTSPWQRPRWAIAVPIAGALAVVLAVIAGAAHDGAFASLGARWFGARAASLPAATLLEAVGNSLGPIVAVAALAGVGLIMRVRLAELAIATCILGALLVDLRGGSVGPATLGIAALCAGLAIGRFAATIRIVPLQAIAGATAGVLLLVPPAWTAIEHGSRVAIGKPSR